MLSLLLWLAVPAVQAQTAADSLQLGRILSHPPQHQIEELRPLLERYPDWSIAQAVLGAAYYELKQYDKVIPVFEKILKEDPALARANNLPVSLAYSYNELAEAKIRNREIDSAIRDLRRAIELTRSKPTALFYYNLGICYYYKGEYENARIATQKAIELTLKPKTRLAGAWTNLGLIYYYQGKYDKAIEAYDTALKIDPENANAKKFRLKAANERQIAALLEKARIFLDNDNPADAIIALNEVLEFDSAHIQARQMLESARQLENYLQAKERNRQGKTESALALLKNVPDSFRDTRVLRRELLAKRSARGADEARKKSRKKLRSAVALLEAGDFDRAEKALTALLGESEVAAQASAYLARIDSLRAVVQREDQNIRRPNASGPAAEKSDSAAPEKRIADTNEPSPPEAVAGKDVALPVNKARAPGAWLPTAVGVGFFFLLVLAGVFYLRHRKATEKQYQPVVAAEEGMDSAAAQQLEEARPEATSPPSQDMPANTMEFFENLVEPADKAEIVEIIEENGEKDSETVEVLPSSFSEQDEEDFLSLVEDNELTTDDSDLDYAASIDPDRDATSTVDMAQFKLRKIGRYIIEKEIGRGSAGRVYKAWDPKLDRTVVIKTVSYSLTASADEIKRLKSRVYREARAAAKLSHPNIVIVYDVEDEASYSYIVMEYIEGPDLRILLDREKQLKPARAIDMILQICKALEFAHSAGIVHRDIKPSNILILEKDMVKVTDFGIAKVTNHLTLTQTGRVVGTPSYMAPEQIEGRDVDGRADIFSLGVVLYEMLTGTRPFSADSLAALAYKIVHTEPVPPSHVNAELPDTYDEVIARAITKDPAERFQTTTEFREALLQVRAGLVS